MSKNNIITIEDLSSMGGKARAAKLTPEDRSKIATKASYSRKHYQKYPKATHVGELLIGDAKISCAVLPDGTRVISESSMWQIVGKTRSGTFKLPQAIIELEKAGGQIPRFVAVSNLIPFMGNDLRYGGTPIEFVHPKLGKTKGYSAHMIASVCELYLKGRDAGVLTKDQASIATQCEIIMRSLAKVGITALVDEVTGYQEERAKNELQKILALYISEELLPWTMRFPHEFFRQLCKLYGLEYKAGTKWPQYFGKFIKKYVYSRLPNGVIEELERLNPSCDGIRSHRHHQFLEPTGQIHLDKQLISVITLMKASDNKDDFDYLFSKINGPANDGV
jgi:hypothetical protein